jgi:hypothetical protein
MAPHWARAVRHMVIFFTLMGFRGTWNFDAEVDAQRRHSRCGTHGQTAVSAGLRP